MFSGGRERVHWEQMGQHTLLYCTLFLDVVNEDNDQKNDENQNKKSFLKGKKLWLLIFHFAFVFDYAKIISNSPKVS